MDILRSCYRSQMRLFNDRPDVLTWGRWHRCPPGADVAPPSVFFSRQWERSDEYDQELGEVYTPRPAYYSGRSDPRLTGLHYCGASAWIVGIPYADRPGLVLDSTGMPTCCQAFPLAPPKIGVGGTGTSSLINRIVLPAANVCMCVTAASTLEL
jgi:hypothetical protein